MTIVHAFLALLLLACYILKAPSAHGLKLSEAFEAAKKNTLTIQTHIIDEKLSELNKAEINTAIRPTLSLSASQLWRDPITNSSSTSVASSSTNAFNSLGSRQHSVAFSASQPLFQGGSEYHLLQAAQFYPQISKSNRVQAELDLYAQLARVFYEILALEEQTRTLREQVDLLEQRITYLRLRVKIGRSRKTDLLMAESQQARLQSELQALKANMLEVSDQLTQLTGLSAWESIEDPLKEGWESKFLIGQESQDSEKPKDHAQLKAEKLRREQMRTELRAVKGSFWPQVDLTGNYYFDRTGSLRDSEWDITLGARWELYSGGRTKIEEGQRFLALEKQELKVVDLERNQRSLVKRLRALLRAKIDEVKKLRIAVQLARKSYEENIRDSKTGLLSDLELLRSLDDYLQIKRSFDQVQFQPKIIYFEFVNAKGDFP